MGKKLYVGNLPFSATDESLQQKFSQVGNVASSKVIKDRDTGRSKGFGFVEMSSEEEANAAITRLNGTDFDGRSMVVSEARPPENGPRPGFGRGNRGGFARGGRQYHA